MPSGLDQSWGFADPKSAYNAGVRAISMYLSWESSKNITPHKVIAYHKAGIASILNWESQSGAPLNGRVQGEADANEAVRQAKALIKEVGYAPKNRLTIYFSCDTDTSSGEYDKIDAYYKAAKTICHYHGFGVGAYGEAALVTHLANAKITDSEWQTLAWSNGKVSPDADFYQSSINDNLGGASVDFDKIIHPALLGAWWPKGSKYDSQGEQIMAKLDADDKKWLLDNLGPTAVVESLLGKRITVNKENLFGPEMKHDVTHALTEYLIGGWNFARGTYYAPPLDVKTLAKDIAAALPKGAGTLTEDELEAAVRKVLNATHLQSS